MYDSSLSPRVTGLPPTAYSLTPMGTSTMRFPRAKGRLFCDSHESAGMTKQHQEPMHRKDQTVNCGTCCCIIRLEDRFWVSIYIYMSIDIELAADSCQPPRLSAVGQTVLRFPRICSHGKARSLVIFSVHGGDCKALRQSAEPVVASYVSTVAKELPRVVPPIA